MTTMKDIANQLHISINAVSIALNDKEGVSLDLRIKILETALKTGYPMKKLNAKNHLKNKTIAVMIEEKKKADLYYIQLCDCIDKEAKLFGYRTIKEYYSLEHFDTPQNIKQHHAVGVIILGNITEQMMTTLQLYNREILCIHHRIAYMNIDTITTNHYLGGYMACNEFIRQGYKDIGFIGDIQSSQNFKDRYLGYIHCLQKHQLIPTVCLTQNIEHIIIQNQVHHLKQILQKISKMPEAFVCVNDNNAKVLINALHYLGYKVPQDIKVIGFDNMEFAKQLQLSSIAVNRQDIAKKAILRIHEMIHENTLCQTILLTPQIIERKSSKKEF